MKHDVCAFYRFVELDDLPALQKKIKEFAEPYQACGTILIANEGINGTIAAPEGGNLEPVINYLDELTGVRSGELKYSFASDRPFTRFKVRLKKEIITMKQPDADPNKQVGTYVTAEEWNNLLDDPEVVLLDINKSKINDLQTKISDLCIHCDVTNKQSVKKAFSKILEIYGGVDILISNAGTAIGGSIAEVNDEILRKSFEDNFFSHQNCASEAVKIMKKQNINGCLLFNISKQSVNPGKNFGPYGLPKSALLNLCKQYAVDYGHLGIRSNGVNADRIRSGLLNDRMIKSRAKAREVSTDEYMRGNLLLNEVKAEDVAKAFFHLAISKKTTGAVLTVDGGNIAASLR